LNNSSKNNSNKENNLSQILNNSDFEDKTSFNLLLKLIVRRKKFFILSLIIFTSFSLIRTTREKIYNPIFKGEFSILINDPINTTTTVDTAGLLNTSNNFLGAANSDKTKQDVPTLRELLLSEYVLKDLSNKYGLNTNSLAQRVDIKMDLEAKGILNFSLQSNDPKKDQLLLEDLSKLYLNYAADRSQEKLSRGLDFLSKQEPGIRSKNARILKKLEKFRKKSNLVDPEREGELLKLEITTMEISITDVENNIKRLKNIKKDISLGKVNSSSYIELIGDDYSNTLQITNPEEKLSQQVTELNEQLGNALRVYTPSSYVVRNIQARLDVLKPKVIEKQLMGVEIAIKSAEDIIKLKKSKLADLNNKFNMLLADINEYSKLSIELKSSVTNLEGINSAKEQLQLELAQDNTPWTIIKPPTFLEARVYPSYTKELSKSLLIAILIALGLAYIRDKFDFVFHSAEEVRDELKYPFLGHVPYVDYFSDIREEQKSIVDDISLISNNENIDSYDKFFYQESLRNIYASLRFLNSDNPIKVITITSSVPKEGKSLINILLSKTLCEMDLKILQIDADLRRPQIHSRLGLNNLTGLSNILTNPDLKLSDAIQTVPGFKNWDVISSGTKPPDPTRLLNSEKMRTFIKELKESDKYDLIIFDTPPVIGIADSLLVSEKSDGLILLVSTNSVNKNLPKESISRSINSGSQFLGIISNATKKESKNLLSNGYEDYAYAVYSTYGINEDLEKKDAGAIAAKKMRDKDNQFNRVKELVLTKIKIIIDKSLQWLDD